MPSLRERILGERPRCPADVQNEYDGRRRFPTRSKEPNTSVLSMQAHRQADRKAFRGSGVALQ